MLFYTYLFPIENQSNDGKVDMILPLKLLILNQEVAQKTRCVWIKSFKIPILAK